MKVPGSNLMALATRVIAQSSFLYFPYASRTLMPNGLWSAQYVAGQKMKGSAQPVERTLYASMGLDFQKLYYNFYLQQGVIDITRDVSGDQFQFQGKNFQVVSKTPWFGIDGWDQCLCVHIPNY